MPGPHPKEPEKRARGNKTSTATTLSLVVDHEVPELPDPEDWLARPVIDGREIGFDDKPVDWSPAVKKWWITIWSSPMSNEFHPSDTEQLHLACFYLHQVTNPYIKMAERLAAAAKHESCVRNFGLTPMSRRSLQWQIEQVKDAQARNKRRGGKQEDDTTKAPEVHAYDPRADTEVEADNPFAENVVPITGQTG